jgi:dipeptidyl aminopeptidase/acylaminoacyl peptidase
VPRPHDRHGRVQFRDHFALATAHGEDHGLDRPSFRQDRLERYLDWYARHLAAR